MAHQDENVTGSLCLPRWMATSRREHNRKFLSFLLDGTSMRERDAELLPFLLDGKLRREHNTKFLPSLFDVALDD
jgi:hypothetical protein